MTKAISARFSVLTKVQKVALFGLPILAAVAIHSPIATDSSARKELVLSLSENQIVQNVIDEKLAQEAEDLAPPSFEYQIQKGDSLSEIFSRLGFNYSDLMQIMEADLTILALDTLKPGDNLTFWKGEAGVVHEMAIQLNLADKVIYSRNLDESYTANSISLPGTWDTNARAGEIYGSFSQSANRVGINSIEVERIVSLFKDKLNFSRDIHKGDRFEIVQSKQYIDGVRSGKSELKAIKIITRGQEVGAYLHSDGQYYDKDGQSLQKAFQRYPMSKRWRITSGFNPKRRHPVTGRVSPHNGTDFGTPVGIPIVSIGDGRVEAVRKHPYAGNYVVIKHDNTYTTRYLHLSRIYVSKGQKIFKGEKIGLSGKSGRVTGPHLHFELLVKGRAVNAMKADIPMATSISKKEMPEFVAHRDELDLLMNNQALEVAANEGPVPLQEYN
ncbi:peptidoglycan DD-metalloendopeptidase family protein [Vibrio sp. WJH972]